jgi:hypothetical protein
MDGRTIGGDMSIQHMIMTLFKQCLYHIAVPVARLVQTGEFA